MIPPLLDLRDVPLSPYGPSCSSVELLTSVLKHSDKYRVIKKMDSISYVYIS